MSGDGVQKLANACASILLDDPRVRLYPSHDKIRRRKCFVVVQLNSGSEILSTVPTMVTTFCMKFLSSHLWNAQRKATAVIFLWYTDTVIRSAGVHRLSPDVCTPLALSNCGSGIVIDRQVAIGISARDLQQMAIKAVADQSQINRRSIADSSQINRKYWYGMCLDESCVVSTVVGW